MVVYTIFLVLLIIVSLLLGGIILIQSGDGGVSSSIGGASMSNTFGSSTPSVMTKITTTLALIFAIITLGLNIYSFKTSANVSTSALAAQAAKGIAPKAIDFNAVNQAEVPVAADSAE